MIDYGKDLQKAYDDGYKDRDAEIVRCKDCKHHEDEEIGMVYCPKQIGGWVDSDWFCADGERKEQNDG